MSATGVIGKSTVSGALRRRVATKVAGHGYVPPVVPHAPGSNGTGGMPATQAIAQQLPNWGPSTSQGLLGQPKPAVPGSSSAPVVAPDAANDPTMPNIKDSTYQGGIAEIINTRKRLTAQLAAAYTNNTANSTTGANKEGLLHSSTLANKLADLKTGYDNDQGDVNAQYGTGDNYGIKGTQLLGDAEQRHANDPLPTVADDSTVQSLNAGRNLGHTSTVHLASGWRILYDASGKPVRFLKPGETFNGQ